MTSSASAALPPPAGSSCEMWELPLDVCQIVLGYITDNKSMAAARQVCKGWHRASAAAPATISVALPGRIADMRSQLALVLQVMPGLAGFHASVGSGADSAYPAECFRQLMSFPGLKALELRFSDSQELSSADVTQLGCLARLTRLHLSNVSLPAATNSSPLLLLKHLSELSLVHHSKVSALMVGNGHLQVLGRLPELTDLVLQGRMCSASDDGLLVLARLTKLTSLAISWVPWQSQITQGAALQLLAALKRLKSLQLGGAELLLPSVPHYPVAAVHAPPAPPAAAPAAAVAALLPQHSLPGAGAAGAAMVAAMAAQQAEVMRSMLAIKAADLDTFKLQFNCCGTGVEKALLSLGDIRGKLTGLQWSYAKLAGASSMSLLGSCTALRSLKLRLWYQDYNLTPFAFKLSQLSGLVNLRTLVVDKRPPFQQQLPVQQGAVSVPITRPMLQQLALCWTQLQKLQLGLARADFGPQPLEGLAGFSQLRSLSVHCYDQGFDDGQFMLPIDVQCLPSSLVKLDLMHVELCNDSNSSSDAGARAGMKHDCSRSGGSCKAGSSKGSSGPCSLRSASTGTLATHTHGGSSSSSSSIERNASSGGTRSSSAAACGNTRPVSRGGFASASAAAFTSMLSESFSMLSRQASVDCGGSSAAYLDQMLVQQQQQQQQPQPPPPQQQQKPQQQHQPMPAAAATFSPLPSQAFSRRSGTGVSAFALSGAVAAAAVAAADCNSLASVSSQQAPVAAADLGSGQLQTLMSADQRRGSGASVAAQVASAPPTSSSRARVTQQLSLPPLPARSSLHVAATSVKAGRDQTAAPQQQGESSVPPPPPAEDAAAAAAAAAVAKAAPRGSRSNPFAAVSAAAAVQAAIGDCAAAVGSPADADVCAPEDSTADDRAHQDQGRGTGSRGGSGLGRSHSMHPSACSGGAKNCADAGGCGCAAASVAQPGRAFLPLLQQLQLKHCCLIRVSLDDIITKPIELRCLQLVEVLGLSARDVGLMPFLANLHRLSVIAAREDAWLGLAPLRLFAKLPELRHLDWVISEKALSGRSRCLDLQALIHYPKLAVLTLHTVMGKYEQLHAVSSQLRAGCHVRLMSPAFCEHATKKAGFGISRLLGVASCLLPGATVPAL